MHTSVRLKMPVEFINVTPINPLISKCQIKVCYVGDEPNRNRSIITKDVARQMANSLPGSPIVGLFNEQTADFEEHSRDFEIKDGKLAIKDITKPYGFVDLNAKVWFAKYLDDGAVEREYLVTEGWLWTGQYPECQRILDKGNNHSMELDEDTINAHWTKDENSQPQFFIINEAIISKLCILGETHEPCFEGSSITAPIQFSLEEEFKERLFSMMKELKDLLSKEEQKMFTQYSVVVGDSLWNALYSHVNTEYSGYNIESVCEDEGTKFAVITSENKYFRLNFSITEEGVYEFATEIAELDAYTPFEEPQFALEDVENYVNSQSEETAEENQDKTDEDNKAETEYSTEEDDSDEKKCPECGKPVDECECEKEEPKKYNLEEIPEYVELQTNYSNLEAQYNALKAEKEELESQIAPLAEFKAQAEKEKKQEMIDSFYMLSDEDKKDVIDNIDTYSIDDIEAKLSIICVRNKVNFDLDNDNTESGGATTYNLNDAGEDNSSVPAWVKAALEVQKLRNQ